MATKVKRIHLMHASMKFSDPDAEYERGLRINLGRTPDILSMTETSGQVGLIREVCRDLGYRAVIIPGETETCFAVHASLPELGVKDQGAIKVAGSRNVNTALAWVHCSFWGVDIYHHVAHWPAKLAVDAAQRASHRLMTDAMVLQVRKKGKTKGVSFFAGDVNDDDDEKDAVTNWNQVFRENGLVTIWDSFRVYPGTHGAERTIDVIGAYEPDRAVKPARYKSWPMNVSDHRPVSAFYDIDVKVKTTTPAPTKPGPAKPTPSDTTGNPKDDDPYATGGNISWDDYLDNTIYQYPQAVDDSDRVNG